MAAYIDDNFMLDSDTASYLYHTHAKGMAIVDYHCHLEPKKIADNHIYRNLTDIWLGGDHYKWRAMRASGVSEEYITGDKSDYEKFEKWAETLPYLMRNPLYHWSHMELSRIFGEDRILKPQSAKAIYERCSEMVASAEFSSRELMKKSNVEIVCTTDDPTDSLEYHKQIAADDTFDIKVKPTWRADRSWAIDGDIDVYNSYLDTLEAASGVSISSYSDLIEALSVRHNYFAELGCRLSDHGLDTFYAEDYTKVEIDNIFDKARKRGVISKREGDIFRSAIIYDLAVMDHQKGWTQQFHIGPIRNNRPSMFEKLGADVGFDAINDISNAVSGHKFFGKLDRDGLLAKSILYNLNPSHSDALAAMAATFNDGTVAGKMQYGAAWWFLDHEQGIIDQLNAASVHGALGHFVGMLTDSRSFLSYPRHEYFRRILCNMLGDDIEKGKLPSSEIDTIGKMVEDISYNNAKRYFEF